MQAAVKFIEKPVTPELGKNGEPIEHQYLKADTSMLRRNQDILNNASKDGGIPDNANKSGASVGGETEGAQTSAQPDDSGVEYNKDLGGKADKEVSDSDSAGKNKEAEKEVAAKPKEDEKKEEPEDDERKCDTCGKAYNEDCPNAQKSSSGIGTHERAGKLHTNQMKYQGKEKPKKPKGSKETIVHYLTEHALKKNDKDVQVHHILDIQAFKDLKTLQKQVKYFDYNVNHLPNLVTLPDNMMTACELAVAYHLAGHDAGRAYTSADKKIKDNLNTISAFEKVKDVAGGLKFDESLGKDYRYSDAVINELKSIDEDIIGGEFCHDASGQPLNKEQIKTAFHEELNNKSKLVLERIEDFSWTITRDGRDFAYDNPADCCQLLDVPSCSQNRRYSQ